MDQIVERAMRKWPDVPRVFGWLRLDRRGRWLLKTPVNAYEAIGNAAITDFIGRNYAHDERGRWYFQNGPQRVFVGLDVTPWICRLASPGHWVTHTGAPFSVEGLLLDETGALLVHGADGVGLLDDRDLAAVSEALLAENSAMGGEDALMRLAGTTGRMPVRLFARPMTLAGVQAAQLPLRFAFDPAPAPDPGEPEC
jgi:hypothetical protein